MKTKNKFENLTIKGYHYLLTKVEIWLLMLAMLVPYIVATEGNILRTGIMEARSSTSVNTDGMSKKEVHDVVAGQEKTTLGGIIRETTLPLKPFVAILGAVSNIRSWGWSLDTCVKFLTMGFWLLLSLLILIKKIKDGIKLATMLKKAGNDGKVPVETVGGYDIPFTGKAFFIVTLLVVVFMFVMFGAPVWLMYLAVFFLWRKEWKAFRAKDGLVYDPPRKNPIIELLREWGVFSKMVRYFDKTYGYSSQTVRAKQGKSKLPRTSSNGG